MANNYYDATGVLILDCVTPVITALFRGLSLDPNYPGNGEAFIARASEANGPDWGDIADALRDVLSQHYVAGPARNADVPIQELLFSLAEHLGNDKDESLAQFIDNTRFDDEPDLEALFEIATLLDDGHNLQAITFQGAWYCDKPRLYEFGGDACYLSRQARVLWNSTETLALGSRLRDAVLANNAEEASSLIAKVASKLLTGLNDDEFQTQVHTALASIFAKAA